MVSAHRLSVVLRVAPVTTAGILLDRGAARALRSTFRRENQA